MEGEEGREGGVVWGWRTSSGRIPNILQPAAALSSLDGRYLSSAPSAPPHRLHAASYGKKKKETQNKNRPQNTEMYMRGKQGCRQRRAGTKKTGRCEIVCVHVNRKKTQHENVAQV